MIFKKIIWTFKRHPFLYRSRFKLLSKNSSISDIEDQSYNRNNSKDEIPKYFFEISEKIFSNNSSDSDIERVKILTKWLDTNIKGGPGLSFPSEDALREMLLGNGGVCSDMAQIFNNFCVINDIKVREWGSTRAPFEREYGGHSFNEVYVKELKKWVLLDVSYGIMFFLDEVPLSVIELYNNIRKGKSVTYKSILDTNKVSYNEHGVNRNYLNSNTVPFLICNYSNKIYDTFLKYTRPILPVFVVHFIVYVLNKSYHYRFPLDDYKKIFP